MNNPINRSQHAASFDVTLVAKSLGTGSGKSSKANDALTRFVTPEN
jgi:hypothetical protein